MIMGVVSLRNAALLLLLFNCLSACGPSEVKEEKIAEVPPASTPSTIPPPASNSDTGASITPNSTQSTTPSPPSVFSFSFEKDRVDLGRVERYTNTIQNITLRNTGTQTMTCYSPYSYSGNNYYGEFYIIEDNCVYRSIAGGQVCTYRIKGSPIAVGERSIQYELSCTTDSSPYAKAFVTVVMTGF